MGNIKANKFCYGCSTSKPMTEFYRLHESYQSRCKECQLLYKRERSNMPAVAAITKESTRLYKEAHAEELKDYSTKYNNLTTTKERKLNWRRSKQYSLSSEEYDTLLEEQNFRCAICGTDAWKAHGPVIDHDHISGRVRGILCDGCNVGLGRFGDSAEILIEASLYLRKYYGN